MYFDFLVKIPDVKGKIYEKTIKGVTYINYEYNRIYKPDKKYNIPKRTTIGKKTDEDIQNEKELKELGLDSEDQ